MFRNSTTVSTKIDFGVVLVILMVSPTDKFLVAEAKLLLDREKPTVPEVVQVVVSISSLAKNARRGAISGTFICK